MRGVTVTGAADTVGVARDIKFAASEVADVDAGAGAGVERAAVDAGSASGAGTGMETDLPDVDTGAGTGVEGASTGVEGAAAGVGTGSHVGTGVETDFREHELCVDIIFSFSTSGAIFSCAHKSQAKTSFMQRHVLQFCIYIEKIVGPYFLVIIYMQTLVSDMQIRNIHRYIIKKKWGHIFLCTLIIGRN